jgi:hypothetical protein
LPIYRAITYQKTQKDDYGFFDDRDEFENALDHRGVGIYWSWVEEGAEPHGGGYGETYVLYGKIKPEFVNWKSTIYKNAWEYMNGEKEIETKQNVSVLIYKIKKYPSGGEINLNPAIIVPT